MNSLKDANISEEDLDKVSEQISDEVIKFFSWDRFTEHEKLVLAQNTGRIIKRKVRQLFGKPLPPLKMRSPRLAQKKS